MLFLQISRHSPESCPMHNEKATESNCEPHGKNRNNLRGNTASKWLAVGIRYQDHLIVLVYEAPNLEALLKFSMVPEVMDWMCYHTTETMPVMTLEESMKLMK